MKSGWVTKKLGEVCDSFNGIWKGTQPPLKNVGVIRATNFTKQCEFDPSRTIFIDVEEKKFNKRKLEFGDIIVERSGGGPGQPVGRVIFFNLREGDYTISNFTSALRVKDKTLLDPYYLHRALVAKYFSGATETMQSNSIHIINLNYSAYLGLEIPIPPLAEQKRIVGKIDAAFEKIDKLKANAEKNLANAKELFQYALDEAMRPKKGWMEKRLGEVCEGKLSYGTSSPSCAYDSQVRYIRITDIDDNGVLLDDLVSPRQYEQKHVLEEGDVVFARTGATVGKSYLYSHSDGKCVYAGYLIRARVNQTEVLPRFLFDFTKTSRYKHYIQVSQAAAAQPNVNAEKYGNLIVPLPSLREQRQIVGNIEKVWEISLKFQQNYARQIADCAEMRQTILREAFEGRL